MGDRHFDNKTIIRILHFLLYLNNMCILYYKHWSTKKTLRVHSIFPNCSDKDFGRKKGDKLKNNIQPFKIKNTRSYG